MEGGGSAKDLLRREIRPAVYLRSHHWRANHGARRRSAPALSHCGDWPDPTPCRVIIGNRGTLAMTEPRLLALATAVPPYTLRQSDVRARARHLFAGAAGEMERLLPVFENAGIATRYSCVPIEWYDT